MESWLRVWCARQLCLRGLRPVIQKRTGYLGYRRDGKVVFFITDESDPSRRPRRIKMAHVYATAQIPYAERMDAALKEAEEVRKMFPGMPVGHSISVEGFCWEGKIIVKRRVLRSPSGTP